MDARAIWRAPELGPARELELPQGRMRYFEGGSGPSIVFVHGYFVNANLWRKVVGQLGDGFHWVVLDLPFGSHALPLKPDADLSADGQMQLVLGAIEQLGLEDVTLVGMDTGGAICQFIVSREPDRVARLVLCSCDYRDNFPPRMFSYLKLLPYIEPLIPILFAPLRFRSIRRLPFAFGYLTKGPTDPRVEDSWSLPALVDRGVRRDILKALRMFDKARLNQAADELRKFDGPALIAWSRDDKVFPPEHARLLAADLRNARLEWIDDARTFSMEEQPERLAQLIADFVRQPQRAAA